MGPDPPYVGAIIRGKDMLEHAHQLTCIDFCTDTAVVIYSTVFQLCDAQN